MKQFKTKMCRLSPANEKLQYFSYSDHLEFTKN